MTKEKTCKNCGKSNNEYIMRYGKKMLLKELWVDIDNKYEMWCQGCRRSYKEDSKIIKERNK